MQVYILGACTYIFIFGCLLGIGNCQGLGQRKTCQGHGLVVEKIGIGEVVRVVGEGKNTISKVILSAPQPTPTPTYCSLTAKHPITIQGGSIENLFY